MEAKIIYGIDLGTTFSSIAYVNQHGEPVCIHLGESGEWTIPSAVLFIEGKKAYVGEEALENSFIENSYLIQFAKRYIGLQNVPRWEYAKWVYTPEDISSLILRKIAQQVRAGSRRSAVRDVVISHPQYFYSSQKEATKEAGELAGLNVLATITEPLAAAIAYGVYERTEERDLTIFVFDLGGGTFDTTLMKISRNHYKTIGSNGVERLGGIDWDKVIMDMVIERFNVKSGDEFMDIASRQEIEELRRAAQKAKEDFSRPMKDMHRFTVAAGGNLTKIDITRSEFESGCQHLVDACMDTCEKLLEDTGYDWSEVDEVLMVGSSTKMPMIQKRLREVSGKDLKNDKDPKLMVAKGAAIWGHWVKVGKIDARWGEASDQTQTGLEEVDTMVISGCTAHSLGVKVERAGRERISKIIKQNTPTPCEEPKQFKTIVNNATSIAVELYEGESEIPNDCVLIGSIDIDGLPPRPKGSPVEVKFNIDVSGRLEVELTDVETGKKRVKLVDRNILQADQERDIDTEARRRHLAGIAVL